PGRPSQYCDGPSASEILPCPRAPAMARRHGIVPLCAATPTDQVSVIGSSVMVSIAGSKMGTEPRADLRLTPRRVQAAAQDWAGALALCLVIDFRYNLATSSSSRTS